MSYTRVCGREAYPLARPGWSLVHGAARPTGSVGTRRPEETGLSEFDDRLRIVPEFRPDEYDGIRKVMFGRLARRLSRWSPEQVELELSVKERDTPSQRVALESWIGGLPKMVATSTEQDLDRALVEVRDDLWRQIDRFVTKKESARKR